MDDKFDKTQPLPRVREDQASQETRLINHNQVRRLEPINVNNRYQANNGVNYHQMSGPGMPPKPPIPPKPPKQKKGGSGKLLIILALSFCIALLMGLLISGYISDQTAKETQIKAQQELYQREASAAQGRQNDLNSRREALDQRIKDLEAQQRAAKAEADKLKGRQEQIDKTKQEKSGAEKVIDKFTGKEAKEEKAAKDSAKAEEQALSKVEEINRSIQEAKETYDEVNRQLDELEAMRQKAIKTKEEAERVYNENKGLIDSVLYYMEQGLSLLK